MDEVYPGWLVIVQRMAPPPGTMEAARFAAAAGLPLDVVYPPPPPVTVAGEARRRRGRARRGRARGNRLQCALAVVGMVVGAVAAGPMGFAVGGGLGLLAGGHR